VTFFPGRYLDDRREVVGMAVRDGGTGKVGWGAGGGGGGGLDIAEAKEGREECGGEGAYGALDEYMKVV
jgi:hypothetical protein